MELKNQVIKVFRNNDWVLADMEDIKPGEMFKVEELPKKLQYTACLYGEDERNYIRAREFGLEDNEKFMDKFRYSLYEVKLNMEVDTETGETWILKVNGVELKEPVKG